jgi:GntR family transcriptional repressor for pyruvate dehydrogenase complex
MQRFERVKKLRLSQAVATQLEEAIISGTFGIGTRLPSEQTLANQFGISRNVVREAFKILQERGLLEIVSGSGAFVSQPNSETTSDALDRYIRLSGVGSSVEAIYEARRILEGENARLAAQRVSAQDLEALSECLTRMREHEGSIERWSEADLDFHLMIARATGNPFLSLLLEPLVGQLRSVIAEGYMVPGATETGLEAHSKLYDCIKAKDPDGAYKVIMDHLYDSEKRVQAYEERRKNSGKNKQ